MASPEGATTAKQPRLIQSTLTDALEFCVRYPNFLVENWSNLVVINTLTDLIDTIQLSLILKASREWPRLAPYLRLRKSKKNFKVSSILLYSTQKTQKRANWRALSDFLTSIRLQNIKKTEEDPSQTLKNFRKMSHKAETRHTKVSEL